MAKCPFSAKIRGSMTKAPVERKGSGWRGVEAQVESEGSTAVLWLRNLKEGGECVNVEVEATAPDGTRHHAAWSGCMLELCDILGSERTA